jgi:hypothetical protein
MYLTLVTSSSRCVVTVWSSLFTAALLPSSPLVLAEDASSALWLSLSAAMVAWC